MTPEEKLLFDWLEWFHSAADFGPADGDVRHGLRESYLAEGNDLPASMLECEGCGGPMKVVRYTAVKTLWNGREVEQKRAMVTCPACGTGDSEARP